VHFEVKNTIFERKKLVGTLNPGPSKKHRHVPAPMEAHFEASDEPTVW
jgi:hypothetical protein